jgi:hypothetical protein
VRRKAAEVVQQPQIEIAAVHEEVLFRERLPERFQLQPGSEHVHQEHIVADEELQEADPRLVVIHVVRLGIEGDFVHLADGAK